MKVKPSEHKEISNSRGPLPASGPLTVPFSKDLEFWEASHAGVHMRVCWITPQKAKTHREVMRRHEEGAKNGQGKRRQREYKPTKAAAIRHQLIRGRFQLCQPILIDPTGFCNNGQHRLEGVIDTKIGMWSLVIFNISSEAFSTMDRTSKSSPIDVLQIMGTGNVGAGARGKAIQAVFDHILKGNPTRSTALHPREFEYFYRKLQGLRYAFEQSFLFIYGPPGKRSPLYGVMNSLMSYGVYLHFICSQVDKEKADVFFRRLESGETGDDQVLIKLRDSVLSIAEFKRKKRDRPKGKTNVLISKAAAVIEGFNAYSMGSSPSKKVSYTWTPTKKNRAGDKVPFPTLKGLSLSPLIGRWVQSSVKFKEEVLSLGGINPARPEGYRYPRPPNIGTVRLEIMIWTPEMAAEVLARKDSPRVRESKSDKVKTIAADMVDGNFVNNGQGLIFTADGRLLDGRMRLLALIRANKGLGPSDPPVHIEMSVITGIQESAKWSIDRLYPRSHAQSLEIEGYLHFDELAAACRCLHEYYTGVGIKGRSITYPHLKDALYREPDVEAVLEILKEVSPDFPKNKTDRYPEKSLTFYPLFQYVPLATLTLLMVRLRAVHGLHDPRIEEFFEGLLSLASGILPHDLGWGRSTAPVRAFFQLKRAFDDPYSSLDSWARFSILVKSWNDYSRGRSRSSSYSPMTGPEPILGDGGYMEGGRLWASTFRSKKI